MKKLFVILAVIAVAALTATSCKKQEDPAITNDAILSKNLPGQLVNKNALK